MDAIQLTQLFVEYAETQKKLEELRQQIETEVLALGESQKIAGVKATYYQPSVETDYEGACRAAGVSDESITAHSTMKQVTRWAELATAINANVRAFQTEKPARVVVK